MSKQISQLTPVSSMGLGDIFHIQQSGIDKKASGSVVRELTKQVAQEVPYNNANSGLQATDVKSALDETYQYVNSLSGAYVLKGGIDLSTGDAALPTLLGGLKDGWLYNCEVAGTITIYSPVTETTNPTTVNQGDRIYYYDTYWWHMRAERLPYDWDANYNGTGSVNVVSTFRATVQTSVADVFEVVLTNALIIGNFISIHHNNESVGICRLKNPSHEIVGNLGNIQAGDDLILPVGRTVYLVKKSSNKIEVLNNGS